MKEKTIIVMKKVMSVMSIIIMKWNINEEMKKWNENENNNERK